MHEHRGSLDACDKARVAAAERERHEQPAVRATLLRFQQLTAQVLVCEQRLQQHPKLDDAREQDDYGGARA